MEKLPGTDFAAPVARAALTWTNQDHEMETQPQRTLLGSILRNSAPFKPQIFALRHRKSAWTKQQRKMLFKAGRHPYGVQQDVNTVNRPTQDNYRRALRTSASNRGLCDGETHLGDGQAFPFPCLGNHGTTLELCSATLKIDSILLGIWTVIYAASWSSFSKRAVSGFESHCPRCQLTHKVCLFHHENILEDDSWGTEQLLMATDNDLIPESATLRSNGVVKLDDRECHCIKRRSTAYYRSIDLYSASDPEICT
ncbi:uncharacterized protein BO88DRAFT_419884 [Aspergillus vadensis CBS 113365]|uniref:Uncharacterized protein n=1 Tax=Aspergillus vadensis (strain CBS 113365 / IMI 142717 / IBT 24658) TaxID=1448311 RepID=A0A319AU27_ASPVC|nr:hypothetical protein BO88DRAFT_419884 [Aspergillus vadensis CBS 113365]PYH63837.1 hypothetical protein BO88DRAFT_419884 [Aspergillus vadensis CBS 113365]